MSTVVTSSEKIVRDIPSGYKRSETGVIPEDWVERPFGEVVVSRRERVNPKKSAPQEFCIELEHIESASGRLLGSAATTDNSSLKSVFRTGDVLFGKLRAYLRKYWLADKDGICSTEIWVLTPRDNKLTNAYLFQVVQTKGFINAASFAYGTHMPRSDWNLIKHYALSLPPNRTEQNAIATVLSDVDELTDSIKNLIVKKRDLKQAAMQQLLTGKTRLPGFNEKWLKLQLGAIGEFRGGNGFPTKHQGATEGKYPFFKVSDMNNEGNSMFMINSNHSITENVRNQIGANTFPAKAIVFAKIGAAIFLERKKILVRESCIDNNMMGFILREGVAYYRFVHYLFLTIKLGKLAEATALPSLNSKRIASLEFAMPKPPEQMAIAEVLSDMDAEITALEQRLIKTRNLKQSMMQSLLTGKTRLVCPLKSDK